MKHFLTGFIFLLISFASTGQKVYTEKAFDLDTNYIESYYNDLIVRIVSVKKNNFIQLKDLEQEMRLRYRPNDYFNMGIGLNYKWFGINIGSKIPYFTEDDDRYGKTTNFGIQTYLYGRKFTIDILAQKTRGYYLSLSDYYDFTSGIPPVFYQRRDIETTNLGLSFNYVLNYRRFSYKAAFKQNELQKKSAGSFILGGGIYKLDVKADSAFVPREIDDNYFTEWRNLDNFQNFTLNASVGYAYSFVPHENWILSGSYEFNVGINQNIWKYERNVDDWQGKISWGNTFRVSGGHHFQSFYLGASYIRYSQYSSVKLHSLSMLNGTNYFEFTLSKRIRL